MNHLSTTRPNQGFIRGMIKDSAGLLAVVVIAGSLWLF